MAPTPILSTGLAGGLHDIADRVLAAPSIDLGRRHPADLTYIFVYADTVADVAAAATAAGTRVFRSGEDTYTDIANEHVSLRFVHRPASEERVLHRPVDVTEHLAEMDA